MNIGNEIVAVQIVGQVDEIVDVADLIAASLHNRNELFLIVLIHLIKTGGKVVEFINALVLSEHIINAMHRTFVVSDKPFLIHSTELILRADTDTLKDLLHFLFGCRELHPFTDERTFIVLTEIGDKRFKVSI